MVKVIAYIFTFFSFLTLNAQAKWGVGYNFYQAFYQTIGIDMVHKTNKQAEILTSILFTNGASNVSGKRFLQEPLPTFHAIVEDELRGWGLALEYRKPIGKIVDEINKNRSYWCNGLQYNAYKFYTSDDEYVKKDNFMYIESIERKNPLNRFVPYTQLIRKFSGEIIYFEIGIGVGYSLPFNNKELNSLRNYNRSWFDFGRNGFTPMFNFRAGAMLF